MYLFFCKNSPKNRYKNVNGGLISKECSHGLIQYFPLIARVHTRANRNKIGTETKIIVTKVSFRYVKSQGATPLEHGKSAIWGVAHPLCRLSVHSISYYTRVKLSMQNRMRFPFPLLTVVTTEESCYFRQRGSQTIRTIESRVRRQ